MRAYNNDAGEIAVNNVLKIKRNNSTVFVIDKGVPIPRKGGGRALGSCKYPIKDLEIGDSFFIKDAKAPVFSAYVRTMIKRNGITSKFTIRAVDGGVRIWRVE